MRYAESMRKRIILGVAFLAAVVLLTMQTSFVSLAYVQTQGTVIAESANIRKDASSTSNVLASVVKGNKLTINDETTDSTGTLWFKVFVDAHTQGYIRSDLIEKEGGNTASTTTTTTTTTNETTETAVTQPKAEVTAIPNQGATVNTDDVRVRGDATTSSNVVSTIKKGTAVTVTGKATGSDSKEWYQVSFIANDATVTGFIRSDFVTLGEPVVTQPEGEEAQEGTEQPTEEVPAEGTDTVSENDIEEPPVNQDYELVYAQNDEGENEWYLYNHIEGVRNRLADVLEAANTNGETVEKAQSQIQKQKMIIILLAIVLVILALAVTLLLFKIRDLYYDDFDDYGNDEEPAPLPRRNREEPRTVRPTQERRPVQNGVRTPGTRPTTGARPVQGTRPATGARPVQGTRPATGARPVQGAHPATGERPVQGARPTTGARPVQGTRPATGTRPVSATRPVQDAQEEKKWKSKNFMTEDDEFEFEFLNWDGEDKGDK